MQGYLFQYVRHGTVVCPQGTVDPGEPVIVEANVCVEGHVERAGGVTPGFGEPPQSGHGQVMDHAGGVQNSVCLSDEQRPSGFHQVGKARAKGCKAQGR